MPDSRDDLVYPDQTFDDRLELSIGGEQFVLVHHRGETDDQLYVWVPGRKALASADYYQGFLPNAGNGKRRQRHVEEWAIALQEMAGLDAALLLPAHGKAITDATVIRENLSILGDTLQYINDFAIAELNKGTRKDRIPHLLKLPAEMAGHPSLNEQYVSPADISKMVIKQYTGWWDEIPSHWTPATFTDQSSEIVALAGGVETIVQRAREMAGDNIKLASHLTDWAWHAEPGNGQYNNL